MAFEMVSFAILINKLRKDDLDETTTKWLYTGFANSAQSSDQWLGVKLRGGIKGGGISQDPAVDPPMFGVFVHFLDGEVVCMCTTKFLDD